jgi:16S rRNA (guanine(966)-N(2))-methyltransferase RsmD
MSSAFCGSAIEVRHTDEGPRAKVPLRLGDDRLMRVIAGEFRSRRLKTIPGLATRPTPDRLRETLFDIVGPRIQGAVFLDAYAGTGAVGIEALSRGAVRCIFLERSRKAAAVLQDNVESLGLVPRSQVVQGAVLTTLSQYPADIAFFDPPYELETEYAAALAKVQAPLVIVQHSIRFDPGASHAPLYRTRSLKQGDNALTFYERCE